MFNVRMLLISLQNEVLGIIDTLEKFKDINEQQVEISMYSIFST